VETAAGVENQTEVGFAFVVVAGKPFDVAFVVAAYIAAVEAAAKVSVVVVVDVAVKTELVVPGKLGLSGLADTQVCPVPTERHQKG